MTKQNLEENLINIEKNLNDAYESNDVNKISKFLSEEWKILESVTGISNKSEFLNAIQTGKLTHEKMTKTIQNIIIKENFAVVVSKGINKGKYLNEIFDSENWITNIYILENNEWFCFMTNEITVDCKQN